MGKLQIMDTTIRDGQQSLWATRMSIGDMLPILPKMDRVGYGQLRHGVVQRLIRACASWMKTPGIVFAQ